MRKTGVVLPGAVSLVLSLHCGPFVDAPVSRLVQEFTGVSPARTRTPAELETAYEAVIASLLDGMGADRIVDREGPQQTFEKICHQASRPGAEARRAALCRVIVRHLGRGVARPGRVWLLRQLERIGGEESVGRLAQLLDDNDPQIRELARRALEKNPAVEAGRVMRRALEGMGARRDSRTSATALRRTKHSARQVALINALAVRGDAADVGVIVPAVEAEDRDVAAAAIAALGNLGGGVAIKTLRTLLQSEEASVREKAAASLLRIGDRFLDTGPRSQAIAVFSAVYRSRIDGSGRIAALRGLATALGGRAIPMLCGIIKEQADPKLRTTAARLAQEIPGEPATRALVAELGRATPDVQVLLLDVLGARGGGLAKTAVIDALGSEDKAVRIAAIAGLERLADESDVVLLAKVAAAAEGDERKAARRSLDNLRGASVDAAILAGVSEQENPSVRAELLRSLGEREFRPAVETLLGAAEDASETVRVAALEALGELGDENDLPALVGLVLGEAGETAREAAEDAVVSTCLRMEDAAPRAGPVLDALGTALGADKASLLRVLGRIQGTGALEALREGLGAEDAEVVDAVVRGLADWEGAVVLDDLLGIARTSPDQTHRVLALRGCIRLVRQPGARSPSEAFGLLEEAMTLAPGDEERKRVLGALGDVRHAAGLGLARSYLENEALRDEAAAAMVAVARNIAAADKSQALAAIKEVQGKTVAEAVLQEAEAALAMIEQCEGYITEWVVSGPYACRDRRAKGLMEIAFLPELDGGDAAAWRPVPDAVQGNPWIFDLTPLDGEPWRCAYARTGIWSEAERPARLELGSDDSVTVWLNGEPVHSKLAYRRVTPGDDKVDVTLKSGWNVLLLKIIQGGGGWGFACGVRSPSGEVIEGLRFRAEPGVLVSFHEAGECRWCENPFSTLVRESLLAPTRTGILSRGRRRMGILQEGVRDGNLAPAQSHHRNLAPARSTRLVFAGNAQNPRSK